MSGSLWSQGLRARGGGGGGAEADTGFPKGGVRVTVNYQNAGRFFPLTMMFGGPRKRGWGGGGEDGPDSQAPPPPSPGSASGVCMYVCVWGGGGVFEHKWDSEIICCLFILGPVVD